MELFPELFVPVSTVMGANGIVVTSLNDLIPSIVISLSMAKNLRLKC